MSESYNYGTESTESTENAEAMLQDAVNEISHQYEHLFPDHLNTLVDASICLLNAIDNYPPVTEQVSHVFMTKVLQIREENYSVKDRVSEKFMWDVLQIYKYYSDPWTCMDKHCQKIVLKQIQEDKVEGLIKLEKPSNKDCCVHTIQGFVDKCEMASGKPAKLAVVVKLYRFICSNIWFLEAYPRFRRMAIFKLLEIGDDCYIAATVMGKVFQQYLLENSEDCRATICDMRRLREVTNYS